MESNSALISTFLRCRTAQLKLVRGISKLRQGVVLVPPDAVGTVLSQYSDTRLTVMFEGRLDGRSEAGGIFDFTKHGFSA